MCLKLDVKFVATKGIYFALKMTPAITEIFATTQFSERGIPRAYFLACVAVPAALVSLTGNRKQTGDLFTIDRHALKNCIACSTIQSHLIRKRNN